MKRFTETAKLIIVNALAALILQFSGRAQIEVQGDVVRLIEQIRNAMPGQGSNGFVVPTNEELGAFATIIGDLKGGTFADIQARLAPYGYTLFRFINSSTSDTLYVLQENSPIQRGWGTYIYNPAGTSRCAIEAPHPIWDTRSWNLAIQTFLRLHARWFQMAGTHRYANSDESSDVAHHTQTVFHVVHQTIGAPWALQIHGFGKSDPSYSGYPDIVISAGHFYPPDELYTLKASFESKGFLTGVFSLSTRNTLGKLGATTNVQGQWSKSAGKSFIHIESDTPIRTQVDKTERAIQAMVETFGSSTGYDPSEAPSGPYTLFPNFPNPFNGVTRVKFDIRTASPVRLSVFDMVGRKVAVLMDEELAAGTYERAWDTRLNPIASGVYYLQLDVNGSSQTRKMVLVQ